MGKISNVSRSAHPDVDAKARHCTSDFSLDLNPVSVNRLPANRDQVVRHRCHNRRCINPQHLTIGDRRDNLEDELGRRANGVDWAML